MYLSLYTYINISRSPPLCQDYTWSFRNSPMGWILLTPPCKEINLRQRWSIVSKAMTQTEWSPLTQVHHSSSVIFRDFSLQAPSYLFSLYHFPPLILPTRTHPLFSNHSEIFSLQPTLLPTTLSLYLLPPPCGILFPLIFAWCSLTYPSGLSINMNSSNKPSPSSSSKKIRCSCYVAS